jgi:hypothetical protein
MPQSEIDIEIVQQVVEAAVRAENNAKSMEAMHKRFEQHVIDQATRFARLEDRMERYADESSKQHTELAGKVEALTDNIGGCIQSQVETAVSPVLAEVKKQRSVMWSVAGGLILLLVSVLGYLLANGNPWNTAIAHHANSVHHKAN